MVASKVEVKIERSKKSLNERGKPKSFYDSLWVHEQENNSTKNWRYITLVVALIPTTFLDVAFALAMHGVAYKYDGKGPSVLYNVLAGMHTARGNYTWAALPLVQDYRDRNMDEDTQTAHKAAFAAGFAYGLWNNKSPKGLAKLG